MYSILTIATAHELEYCIYRIHQPATAGVDKARYRRRCMYICTTLLLTGAAKPFVYVVAVTVVVHGVPRALCLVNLLAVAVTQCLVVQCTPALASS